MNPYDYKVDIDISLDFDDVLIRPLQSSVNSRSLVSLERDFVFKSHLEKPIVTRKREIKWSGIPIIAANMDTTGTFEVYNVLSKYKMLTAMNKFYRLEDYKKHKENLDPDYFMVSTGITDENYGNLVEILTNIECKWICIDVANGYIDAFFDFCCKVRAAFPNKIIVAGNVCTIEMTYRLLYQADVDIVKIGIGPGSACLTRRKTGVGIPQLSAILECKPMDEGYIISDGGIRCPGDVAKAFGAGADFVMIGGEFAGHDENPGTLIEEEDKDGGEKYKLFYGMSSKHAMERHYGGMEKYRASEGAVIKMKYKGALEDTVLDYLGGLRSACTYVNADNLVTFRDNVVFNKLK
jgi:GMP reductase